MILQALNHLYGRLEQDKTYGIALPGFSLQKISFRVVIKEDGSFLDPEDARSLNEKRKPQTTEMEVPGAAKPSGSGINPRFLWDNQTYMLGRQPEDKKDGFGQERFDAFKDHHLKSEQEIDCPAFSAVCRFLEKWDPSKIDEFQILKDVGPGFGVFQILGQKNDVHETPEILNWWRNNRPKEESGLLGQCLITGETKVPIARLHPKIKGVTGAQSSGAPIVSFNDTAYESYMNYPPHGPKGPQGKVSPIGEEAAFQYGTALNALLTGPMAKKHRLRIGDTTCVFWTERKSETEDVFADVLGGGSTSVEEAQDTEQRERIERFLRALRSGTGFAESHVSLNTPFYLLGLAPNAARISIRFFHRSSIKELLTKLKKHQECIKIVREFEESKGKRPADPEFPAIWQMLNQTARVSDEIPPLLGGALTRAIIEGTPYPEGLFTAVIRRIHADRKVNYLRATLLKAVLLRNHKINIPIMLDPNQTDSAYLLGRLFAALEKTQEEALPSIKTTIRDSFYSSASATPASVFPRLLRTYQHHLAKLTGGAKVNREKLVQEIMDSVQSKGFPTQLNLRSQGVFAIGYYHQRKDFYTKKENKES